MAVNVMWDDEAKTIIRYEMYGQWTWTEFWQAYEQAVKMLETVDYVVHFITYAADAGSAGYVPPNFFSQLPRFYKSNHPKAGITVRVPGGKDLFSNIYENVVARLFPQIYQRLQSADTLEAARIKIQAIPKTASASS